MSAEIAHIGVAVLEVELTEDQRAGLEEADRWVVNAMAELGAAALEHQEAAARAQAARRELERLSKAARHAEQQRAQVLRAIAGVLSLPPGEWTYNAEQGKLMRKEPTNVKPT